MRRLKHPRLLMLVALAVVGFGSSASVGHAGTTTTVAANHNYDHPVVFARGGTLHAGDAFPNVAWAGARSSGIGLAAKGASSAADASRLAAQLTREEAEAIFTKSGGLKSSVIRDSARIASASGNRIGNPDLVADLKALGGSISDWGKYTTPTFKSPAGRFQVHFYYNPTTGQAYYGRDYKAIFAGRPR